MTLIIEDSSEVACSHCVQLRRTFILIAVSSVLPMVIFTALLLLLAAGKMESLDTITSPIVEFVFGLLYVQLFVAIAVLIVSFIKRRHPILKYHISYLFFHIFVMITFFLTCLVMTAANACRALFGLVLLSSGVYFYGLYYFLRSNNSAAWINLRRAF